MRQFDFCETKLRLSPVIRHNMEKMLNELLFELNERLVKKWYPLSIDNEEGGYFTNISYDWKLLDQQEKMIVTQSRHMWLCSKAALFFNDDKIASYARHGFDFLIG